MTRARRLQVLVQMGYDGGAFHGVTPQPGLPTVGGAVRARLADAAGERPRALGFTARTDAGVHARGNFATCWFPERPDGEAVCARVSAPRDDGLIAVSARVVDWHVHARGVAVGKRYRYRVWSALSASEVSQWQSRVGWAARVAGRADPGTRVDPAAAQAWQIAPALDVQLMRQAAAMLVGRRDFSAFRSTRCKAQDRVRTVTSIGVSRLPDRRGVDIVVEGEGFLRQMVRILAGTLVEVGAGLRSCDAVAVALGSGLRRDAGMVAPSRGLTLEKIITEPIPDPGQWRPR